MPPTPDATPAAVASAAPPGGQPTHRRFILIGLVFLHTLHTYIDRVCISAAAGDIKRELAISDQMMGNIFGVFAIGYALFQIPAGWMADRYGARRALTWVVGVWSAFTALTGLAFNAVSLLVIRFLFGVGESGALLETLNEVLKRGVPLERALPAFTRIPATFPPEDLRCCFASRTGAACTTFCVNPDAAAARVSETISATSSWSACFRIPAYALA